MIFFDSVLTLSVSRGPAVTAVVPREGSRGFLSTQLRWLSEQPVVAAEL